MFKKNPLYSILGLYLASESYKEDENDLKKGFRLEPTDFKIYEKDRSTYCHLYKNGVKVSDNYFRKGGLSSGFKGEYCSLIHYKADAKEGGSSLGEHCIIDLEGNIIYTAKSILSHPYLVGGIIVVEDGVYTNLKTSEEIVRGSKSLKSKEFIFVENSYNKEFEIGVYKIELASGKVEIFK